jgi:hypothetical protein
MSKPRKLVEDKAKPGHFRVARNIFGDYWVGLTDEAIDNRKVFAKLDLAIQRAVDLTEDRTFKSEIDRDCAIDELRDTTEEDLSVVPKSARF